MANPIVLPEALWVQAAAYDASEDSKLGSALVTAGVVAGGFAVTKSTSALTASISAGRAWVPDGQGGLIMAYSDSAQTLTFSANATGSPRVDTIYLTVLTTTNGKANILAATSPPSTPYLILGTMTVPAGAANLAAATAAAGGRQVSKLLAADGTYLPLVGGTLSGQLLGTRLTVSGVLDATTGQAVNMPLGARIGGTASKTGRWSAWVVRDTAAPVNNNVETVCSFNGAGPVLVKDYPVTTDMPNPYSASKFYAPVTGIYSISSSLRYAQNNVGNRYLWARRYKAGTSGAVLVETRVLDNKDTGSASTNDYLQGATTFRMNANEWLQVETLQSSGAPLSVLAGTLAGGDKMQAVFALVQVS